MCIKAVVSQQSNKVDDLIDVLVVVRFVRYEDPPCIQEQEINNGGSAQYSILNTLQTCWSTLTLLQRERRAVWSVLLFGWSVVAAAWS